MKADEDRKVCEYLVFPGLEAGSLRIHGFLYGVPKGTFLGISLRR